MRKLRRGVLALGLVLIPFVVQADTNTEIYGEYQHLLDDYLIEEKSSENGLVAAFDYDQALADDQLKQRLSNQRQALREFDPESLTEKRESIAFWINAYNFFMIEQLLTEQPDGELVSSVWDYGGKINPFVDSVFERENFNIGGHKYSLDRIEKGILLGDEYQAKGWKDARIHFSVNCAAVGCPALRQQIYTADNLEALLAGNTRWAFKTPRHLQVKSGRLHVTELFKWYEADFVEASGSARAFIQEWADPDVAERVSSSSGMAFIDYDWRLNRPDNFPEFR